MNAVIERGRLFFQQGRYDLALQEFQQALAADPHDPFAHSFAALCLVEQKQYLEASEAAARAVTSGPDLPFAHYVTAHIFHQRNRTQASFRDGRPKPCKA